MSDWQERLGEAMDARGISGGELARRTGFTSQYINSMRSKERGARLPLDTARRLAHALGVSVEWLTIGTGPRERLSDVYPVFTAAEPGEAPPTDRYPSRGEAVALLSTTAAPEVIAALRAFVPADPDRDPGRDFWIARAKELAADLRRIKADPAFGRADESGAWPPASEFRPSPHARPPQPPAPATARKKTR